jgi:4-hydroxy-tetrahydrodipicolinate synthase
MYLQGPIPSIRTPFKADGDIDFESLRRLVDFCIAAGAKTIMLTAGDSHFICLSDQEIVDVTRVVCEQAAGKAMIISGDRFHSTKRSIDLAVTLRGLGMDLFMPLPCDWGASTTPNSLAEHYAAIARHVPVMIVTNIFIPRGVEFGLETIRRSLDLSDQVVAIKDDMGGDFIQRLCMAEHNRVAITAGGTKRHHLHMASFGSTAGYLSTFMTFKPDIAHRYWNAIVTKNWHAAREIVREIDLPLFDHVMRYAGGFDAAMHGIMEIYGISVRWRRPPYHSLTDAEMEKLRDFLRSKHLL